ncbi:P-selectin glycoprotein ligand 1 [Talpa occidentalis]|uniref:P-selectin glycoprotein ligand 1 n=1 Tax=Talpa occidentalis TaxID=50954 RepID=UPI001890966B|nr:P-selectin glycoprotein ligand 1 [Talpa occidentalis]
MILPRLPPLLLLLTLLGPGSSLQLWKAWEDGSMEAPGLLLSRDRRQVTLNTSEEVDFDYVTEGTDDPETLENSTEAAAPLHQLLAVMGTSGQSGSAGPGTPEPATLEVATVGSAGGPAVGNERGALTTQGMPVTPGPLTKYPATAVPSHTDTPSAAPTTVEVLPSRPASTEALSTLPATTEALFVESTHTEALAMAPVATEALATAEATVMTALGTGPAATAAPATEPATTEALPTDPATMQALATEPAPPSGLSTRAASRSPDTWRKRQNLLPKIPTTPSPTRAQDYIPVKQCLLAILILALVATVFLVCTVVLAIRLSRKRHMYPVRSYSPTEMVCISAVLPEGGEGPAATTATTTNGDLPNAKSQDRKAEPGPDRDGDDLTLHSFLP